MIVVSVVMYFAMDSFFYWYPMSGRAVSGEERDVVRKLKSALLLPIISKEGLLGVISIGAHLGDLPFSSEDKRLLLSVGGPASFALENIPLIERTIDDARGRLELGGASEERGW